MEDLFMEKSFMRHRIALLAALFTVSLPALADENNSRDRLSDAEVAGVASTINRGEIRVARLARRRAENDQVKAFARSMRIDHKRLERQLTTVLSQAGFAKQESRLSEKLKRKVRKLSRKLRRLQGAEFDRAFIKAAVKSHRKTIRLIERVLLPETSNDLLKSYLSEVLPIIQAHYEEARRIARDIGLPEREMVVENDEESAESEVGILG
jgi:putative membrane protein